MKQIQFPVTRPDKGIFPIGELTDRSASDYGDSTALRWWEDDRFKEMSYRELAEKAAYTAAWIMAQGLNSGSHIAILGDNCPQWGIAYLAVLKAGMIVVPVDRLLPVSGVKFVLTDSDASILFAGVKYIEALKQEDSTPPVNIVSFEKCNIKGVINWEDVLAAGAEKNVKFPKIEIDSPAAILYTSGTTGHSKGIMLTHRNIISNTAASSQCTDMGPGDNLLSIMPLHHSFECTAGFLQPLYCGAEITYGRRLRKEEILEDIRNTNVTIMGGVPLLFDKFKDGILREVRKKGIMLYIIFKTLLSVSAMGEIFNLKLGIPLFRSIRQKAGFGSVKIFVSGGGPFDPKTSRFFLRFGIPVLQGFGLTETSPVTHFTPLSKIRHCCVGLPIVGVSAKIADPDKEGIGELCIKGPNVFKGYYKNDDAYKEVFDSDGWFHTGDLGIIHDDGYLQITGRKKNLIVTGAGKNVYPEEIEHHLNRRPFIAESLVLGVKRSSGFGEQVGALILPDYEQIADYAAKTGKSLTEVEIEALIKSEIATVQKELPEYKHIRHYKLVKDEFIKTTTRKIKRFLYDEEIFKQKTNYNERQN